MEMSVLTNMEVMNVRVQRLHSAMIPTIATTTKLVFEKKTSHTVRGRRHFLEFVSPINDPVELMLREETIS